MSKFTAPVTAQKSMIGNQHQPQLRYGASPAVSN